MNINYKRIFVTPIIFVGLCLTLSNCNDSITWEEAQKADTYQAYQRYIKSHPDGKYIAKAQKLAESSYWNSIEQDTTAKKFKTYLKKFPDGAHKLKAEIILNQLVAGGKLATKAKVTGSSVIIRSNHTTDSPSVGVVAREGTIVQLLDWYSVGGNNGALLKQRITVVHDGKQYVLPQGKAIQILLDLKDSVHISFASPHNASVEVNISKDVVESMSGQMWYKIHTKDGITGWIYGKFIKEL